jgi:hypothetical protein
MRGDMSEILPAREFALGGSLKRHDVCDVINSMLSGQREIDLFSGSLARQICDE